MKLGDKMSFPGPGDEVIWYNGPLSFFFEFSDGIYYFHEFGCSDGVWNYATQFCTPEEKRAFLNNEIDFYSFIRSPRMVYINYDTIVEIRELDELELGSLPDRGVFWSRDEE